MKHFIFGFAALSTVIALVGCGGGSSSTSNNSGGTGGGGGTVTPALKGTALVTVDTIHNTATVQPLQATSRDIFSGSAVSLSSVKVSEDAGEVTTRQLAITFANNTQTAIHNPRFTITGLTPLIAPDIDDRANVNVSTFAGTGAPGTGSGSLLTTPIGGPYGEWVDTDGAIYVTSSTNFCIRKIKNGEVSTVLSRSGIVPYGITGDANYLFYSDYSHQDVFRIRKDGSGETLIAGTASVAGDADGAPGTSKLSSPAGLTLDSHGNLYIACLATGAVREVANPDTATNCTKLNTVSGSYSLADINLDGVDYLVDGQYSSVAKVNLINTTTGSATPITGTTSTANSVGPANTVGFNLIKGIAVKGDAILLSQAGKDEVSILYRQSGSVGTDPTAWTVGLIAGNGSAGSSDGLGFNATFNGNTGLAFAPDGSVLVADVSNNKIRRVVIANASLYDGAGTSPATGSVSVSGADTYVANINNTSSPAFVLDGDVGAGTSSTLNPWTFNLSQGVTSFTFIVTVDGQTNYDGVLDAINIATANGSPSSYIRTLTRPNFNGFVLTGRLSDISTSDTLSPCFTAVGTEYLATSNQILQVDTAGNVKPVAGSGSPGATDGTGLQATFTSIKGIVCDKFGTAVYVLDGAAVRRFDTNTLAVSTIAGAVSSNTYARGNGSVSRFFSPQALGIAADGQTLYIADSFNYRVSVITLNAGSSPTIASNWLVVNLAGNGSNGYADGVNAQFGVNYGLAVSPGGDIYVTDLTNLRIRKITPGGLTSTFTGSGVNNYVDGPAGSASFISPTRLVCGGSGYLYLVENNSGIRRVSPNGDVETVATISGNASDGPASINSTGNIFTLGISPSGVLWYASINELRSIERIVGN